MCEKNKCPICNKETMSFVEGVCSSCFNRDDKLNIIFQLQATIDERDKEIFDYNEELADALTKELRQVEEVKELKEILSKVSDYLNCKTKHPSMHDEALWPLLEGIEQILAPKGEI